MQDGNIHCHVDNLSRRNAKGEARIAVASAAYVSGCRLWSEVEQRAVEFGMREDVVFSEIVMPPGAPDWASDRETLWNRVDLSARRRDARLAKTVVAAIARDIPTAERVTLLRAFVAPFVAEGCVVDAAIHEDGTDHNPHLHVLMTTRGIVAEGFGDKLVALEQKSFVKHVRKRWADLTNDFLKKAGSTLRVDHRSYKARGIAAEPTVHRGPDQRERRDKREHARRVREEREMPKPDAHERRDYPLLTARETWPPGPEPSPDMTRPERDEHRRYWEDRKIDRLEARYHSEADKPWYQQALERAQAESGREAKGHSRGHVDDSREPTSDHDRLAPDFDYDADVLHRALAMRRTHEEAELLDAVRYEPADVRRFVKNYILHERTQTVRDQDLAARLEHMQPDVRDKLEALRPRYPDRERDLPVPGPDRELLSREQVDRAQEDMLNAFHRHEPQRDEWER